MLADRLTVEGPAACQVVRAAHNNEESRAAGALKHARTDVQLFTHAAE